jgi:hypothetical protein
MMHIANILPRASSFLCEKNTTTITLAKDELALHRIDVIPLVIAVANRPISNENNAINKTNVAKSL